LVENFLEEERVCMLLTGLVGPRQWGAERRAADVFDLKGEFSDLLEKIALDKGKLIYYSTSNTLAENALAIEINGSYAGFLGSIRAEVLKKFGIEQEVFAVEANVRLLDNRRARRYQQLPRFPRVKRDVAFVVDLDTPAQSVEDAIRAASTGLLQEVELFDVYQGENLLPGKKSLAFAVVLMSADRTLKDSEIDAEIRRMVIHLEKQFGASLRSISQTD
jgi:phenylalanyl-tRNA synthetase beta chain